MAESREVVAPEALSVTNASLVGHRGFHDAAGALIMLKPGEQIADVQVPGPHAENMRQWSTDGTSDLVVAGSEPPQQEGQGRSGEKQITREELNELERENLRAALGQQKPGEAQAPSGSPSGAKLSRNDMEGMTKAELVEYAGSLGVEVPSSASKGEVADAIARAQRRG